MRTLFRNRERDRVSQRAEAEAKSTTATIATAAVKAEALVLVGQLRETLEKLDDVLQEAEPEVDVELVEVGQTGEHGRPDASA